VIASISLRTRKVFQFCIRKSQIQTLNSDFFRLRKQWVSFLNCPTYGNRHKKEESFGSSGPN